MFYIAGKCILCACCISTFTYFYRIQQTILVVLCVNISHVSSHVFYAIKQFATNFTRNRSLVPLYRSSTVFLPLMSVKSLLLLESFVAEFARKPPVFVRLNSTLVCLSSAGRVVPLVVCVQLFNAVMVTLTDLTHDVSRMHLQQTDTFTVHKMKHHIPGKCTVHVSSLSSYRLILSGVMEITTE